MAQRNKIQRLISQQLQLQRQQRELVLLPNLPPAHAAVVHNPLSPDDFAIRQQGLINCLLDQQTNRQRLNDRFLGTEQVSCDGSPSLLYLR